MIHLRGLGGKRSPLVCPQVSTGEFTSPSGGIKSPRRVRRRVEAVTKVRLLASIILRPRKRGRL